MDAQELFYLLALTRITSIGLADTHVLYDKLGSAQAIYEHRNDLRTIIPEGTERLFTAIKNWDEALSRAEAEIDFIIDKKISCLCKGQPDYPQRLEECDDAPLVLFYKGNANLNTSRILSIVGTRKCTEYGKDLCNILLKELSSYDKNILIVSGLAYGIDINAHRNALDNDMHTVGVLAHGLDTIYPALHRRTASEMVSHGGLLTEYMSQTNADKRNFVQRNRIVAGIADATIVIESASKGGSLITAGIAESYHRDCFAFPGRNCDTQSRGCNELIRKNQAILIQSGKDLIESLCWDDLFARATKYSTKQPLYETMDFSEDEQAIVNLLKKTDGRQINQLAVESSIPVPALSSILFDLEMKGIVKPSAGGIYRLLRT